MTDVSLEPEAQAFADVTAQPPYLYEIGPAAARQVLEDVQAAPGELEDVDEAWHIVQAEVGDVRVRVLRPIGVDGTLPVILYVHGGGWILGSAATHDRLVRELVRHARAALVFVDYDRSPEVQYPVAIEQIYATAKWLTLHGDEEHLDASRMAIAGDSVGGCMAAAVAILAKRRGDVSFVHQSLYYPVTDARQDSESYRTFAGGPFLTAKSMAWFWDAYAPDHAMRDDAIVSPLRASTEDLTGLPEALVIVDENDVLRDEGEAYGRRLMQAGVRTTSIRFNGAIHDFMMLNPLRPSAASTAAIGLAGHVLRTVLAEHGEG